MLKRIHPVAGAIGFLTILTFWLSTAASEAFGSPASVAAVKQAIAWGLLLLVPALAITGASGFRMAGSSREPRIVAKKRRMPVIAANGVVILVPAALYLAHLAARGDFGTWFYAVPALELIAGAVNLTLMSFNIRDGLRLAGRLG
ncbi:MAG: hypothetical protein ACLP8B_04985 [Xanthobacteraceae bacterium]